MTRFEFCQRYIHLDGAPISFADRPYLPAIYDCDSDNELRRLVLRCARQVEKTQLVCNWVVHAAATLPGVRIVVVLPRDQQARVFANSRLIPTILHSPALAAALLDKRLVKPPVQHMILRNHSEIYIRAAFRSADAARGIAADWLFVDELQDIAGGDLPVLEQCLSHSKHRRVILTGTPKSIDNHLEAAFHRTTACAWQVPCVCGQHVTFDERCLGLDGPMCPACSAPINPKRGLWVPQNPQSTWGHGYWLNQLCVPWRSYRDLSADRQDYDPVTFLNECLGLPSVLGDHLVTQGEVEGCCRSRPMAQSGATSRANIRAA